MTSALVFRSAHGPWSVWVCACGCDTRVVISTQQEIDCGYDSRYYARHHQPLGASPDRMGRAFEGEGSQDSPSVQKPAINEPNANGEASVEVSGLEWGEVNPNDPNLDTYDELWWPKPGQGGDEGGDGA